MRLSFVTRARLAASKVAAWPNCGDAAVCVKEVTFPPCRNPPGIPRALPRACRSCGAARWSRRPRARSSPDAATPRWRHPTPFRPPARRSICAPFRTEREHPDGSTPAALAAHQPGVRHEEAAGRRCGADLPARAGVAERRGQRSACARVHHAGMVPSRRRHGRADRRDHGLSARRPAAGRHLPRRHHRPLTRSNASPSPRRSRATSAPMCWPPPRMRRRSLPPRGRALRENESWEDLFFRLLLGAGRAASRPRRIPPSSPIGPPRRPHWRAAIRPIRASPRGSSCSSAASNWPTPSSN